MIKPSTLHVATLILALTHLTLPTLSLAEDTKIYKTITTEESTTKKVYDHFGLGITLLNDTMLPSTSSLTATLGFGNRDALVIHFGIPGSSPLQFAVGGVYKHTIHQEEMTGFHVGAGLAMGMATSVTNTATSDFFATIIGVAGIHFQFKELPKILFNLDAGPSLMVGSGRNNFRVGVLSLGVSYFF